MWLWRQLCWYVEVAMGNFLMCDIAAAAFMAWNRVLIFSPTQPGSQAPHLCICVHCFFKGDAPLAVYPPTFPLELASAALIRRCCVQRYECRLPGTPAEWAEMERRLLLRGGGINGVCFFVTPWISSNGVDTLFVTPQPCYLSPPLLSVSCPCVHPLQPL